MKLGIFTLAIILFAVPAPASSQPAASDDFALLTVNQYRRLLRRDLMDAESKRLKAEGKLADALRAADEVVTVEREVFGKHQRVVDALSSRASLEMDLQDFAAARKSWE